MRKIVYYVATSLDGYIAGSGDAIDGFLFDGPLVKQYQADLLEFDTTIMGRRTYEFGYQYGLQPGQPAYPHMKHYIFSNSLRFEHPHEQVKVVAPDLAIIQELKAQEGSGIYLCGGGVFAGWLLEAGQIDVLKIKLNPIVIGSGIRLFGDATCAQSWQQQEVLPFEDGGVLITYERQ